MALALEAKKAVTTENEMLKQWNEELKRKLEEAMKSNLAELQKRRSMASVEKQPSPDKEVSLLSEAERDLEEEAELLQAENLRLV